VEMSTFEIVRTALVDLDPEGLLRLGCDPDEYDHEAKLIADAIDGGVKPSAELVRLVWEKQFSTFMNLDGMGSPVTKPLSMDPVFYRVAERIRVGIGCA